MVQDQQTNQTRFVNELGNKEAEISKHSVTHSSTHSAGQRRQTTIIPLMELVYIFIKESNLNEEGGLWGKQPAVKEEKWEKGEESSRWWWVGGCVMWCFVSCTNWNYYYSPGTYLTPASQWFSLFTFTLHVHLQSLAIFPSICTTLRGWLAGINSIPSECHQLLQKYGDTTISMALQPNDRPTG